MRLVNWCFIFQQFIKCLPLISRCFKVSLNTISFFSFLTIPFLAKTVGYGWAFGVPGILVGVATLIFWLGRKRYVMVPPTRATRTAGFLPVLWTALSNRTGGGFWDGNSDKAHDLVGKVGLATAVGAVLFLGWTLISQGEVGTWITAALAAASLLGALAFDRIKREGWAFTLTGVTIALAVVTLFMTLYPNVMPSSTDPAYNLTIANASSTPYILKVMTWVALVMTPIVLVYQAWTFWVFRRRIGTDDLPPAPATMTESVSA